jgi:integrase
VAESAALASGLWFHLFNGRTCDPTRSALTTENTMSHARQRTARAAPSLRHQPRRRADWNQLSPREILARYTPGETSPLKVLEILINLFNKEHTARQKEVSFKTREERAQFLRRFFHDLKEKAGFKTLPDPRNVGHRHVKAVVAIWQQEKFAPATIQTYLSFLRGFAQWIGKPGLIRPPAHYGLKVVEYQRHQAAERDKSWPGNGVDVGPLIANVCNYDPNIGVALKLMDACAMRKKEALMFRPHRDVVHFEATGLPPAPRKADLYLCIHSGAKGGRERLVPLNTSKRLTAIEHARQVVSTRDGRVGSPFGNLKQAMDRFDNVMKKFGITKKRLGVTSHGLRHGALIDQFQKLTGAAPPVRGGTKLPKDIDTAARLEVADLAGHARPSISRSYLK